MSDAAVKSPSGEDRDRILATLMEEWSPLQRDLMDRLHRGEDDSSAKAMAGPAAGGDARPGHGGMVCMTPASSPARRIQ